MTNATDTEDKLPPLGQLCEVKHGNFKTVDQAMLLAGKTDKQIAAEFGVSRATVIKYRKRLGYRTVRTIADDR